MKRFKISLLELIVLIGLTLLQLITVVKSGSLTPFGLSFWGPHGHDAIFHLSLIEQFKQHPFSLTNPLFLDHILTNYHLGFDWLLGVLARLTQIPAPDWYFRLAPAVASLLLGYLTLLLTNNLGYTRLSRLLSLLLIYAGGSLGHLVSLISGQTLWAGESLFWATQAISALINPPFVWSLILLLSWLLIFNRFAVKPDWKRGVILTLLVVVILEIKAYAAVLIVAGLCLLTLWGFVVDHRFRYNRHLVVLSLVSGVVLLVGLRLAISNSQNLLVLKPLYLIHAMLASPDRLNLPQLAAAWDNYFSGGRLLRLSVLQLAALGLFVIGNFGTRLAVFWRKNISSPAEKFMVAIGIIGIIPGLLFIQTGTPWNTIQFLYYSLFAASILAAPVWARWLSGSRNLAKFTLFAALFAFLTLPTTVGTLKDYLSPTPASDIPYLELRALSLLNSSSRVLTLTYSREAGRPYAEPKPLAVYESSGYIAALTGASTFMADEVNLKIMNYDLKTAKKANQRFFQTRDQQFINGFLTNHQINIIYLWQRQPASLGYSVGWKPIFDSAGVSVYTQIQ